MLKLNMNRYSRGVFVINYTYNIPATEKNEII